MENVDLFEVYRQSLKIQKLQSSIEKFQTKSYFKGSIGSDLSLTISEVFKGLKKPFLIIFENKESAAFHFNDLEVLLPRDRFIFILLATGGLTKLMKLIMQMFYLDQKC